MRGTTTSLIDRKARLQESIVRPIGSSPGFKASKARYNVSQ